MYGQDQDPHGYTERFGSNSALQARIVDIERRAVLGSERAKGVEGFKAFSPGSKRLCHSGNLVFLPLESGEDHPYYNS
jgi:hypothetical protein